MKKVYLINVQINTLYLFLKIRIKIKRYLHIIKRIGLLMSKDARTEIVMIERNMI